MCGARGEGRAWPGWAQGPTTATSTASQRPTTAARPCSVRTLRALRRRHPAPTATPVWRQPRACCRSVQGCPCMHHCVRPSFCVPALPLTVLPAALPPPAAARRRGGGAVGAGVGPPQVDPAGPLVQLPQVRGHRPALQLRWAGRRRVRHLAAGVRVRGWSLGPLVERRRGGGGAGCLLGCAVRLLRRAACLPRARPRRWHDPKGSALAGGCDAAVPTTPCRGPPPVLRGGDGL
jgi:hypothetical protein